MKQVRIIDGFLPKKKVTGEEPGKELKEWSYSPQEIAELLGVSDHVVYELIKKKKIETVVVNYWKRVPKESFYKWYNSQTRYRTKEDKERDAAIDNAKISMPEMASLLGVKRNTVYSILKSPQYKDIFEIVIVADRKKIKNNQPRTDNGNLKYFSSQEAAVVAKVSRSTIYDWINKKCFPVTYVMNIARIPRQEFELFLKKREEGGDINHGINSRKKR